MQVFISWVIILAVTFWLVLRITRAILRVTPRKVKKQASYYIKKREKSKSSEKMLFFKDIILKQIKQRLNLNKYQRDQLQKQLDILAIDSTPEDLRAAQLVYAALAIFIVFLATKFGPAGWVTIVLIPKFWAYPIKDINDRIKQYHEEFSKELPSLYTLLCSQLSKSSDVFLGDIIKDYIPSAGRVMTLELGKLLDDIETGEIEALRALKKRLPLKYVIRMCDVLEARLSGYADSISQLGNLKAELDLIEYNELKSDLLARKKKAERSNFILLVILAIYMIAYFIIKSVSAFELFVG